MGLVTGLGLDRDLVSYGRAWNLEKEEDQNLVAKMICWALRPKAVHCGTPCTHMCLTGLRDIETNEDHRSMVVFTVEIGQHQREKGLLFSAENPRGSCSSSSQFG
jgi:hypothetical protein